MTKLTAFVFGLLRLLLGIAGAVYLVGGLWGSIDTALQRAWGPMVAAILCALVGYAAAYGAFVRFPWERPTSSTEQAG